MIVWCTKYFTDSFKNIKVFIVRIKFNKVTAKFLFYCFLCFYFTLNVSVTVSVFVNFYCEHGNINQSYNLTYYIVFAYYLLFLHYLFFFISTDCSLVNMTSYYLNPSLVSNLCAVVVLQSVITLVANSLHVNILLGCFFCSSTS